MLSGGSSMKYESSIIMKISKEAKERGYKIFNSWNELHKDELKQNRIKKLNNLKMNNFITDSINGTATDIDDYIDQWHDSDDESTLYEFLGMTKEEYSLFCVDHKNLAIIIENYKDEGR